MTAGKASSQSMNDEDVPAATDAAIASQVRDFYEAHPYPPPVDDLQAYRQVWDDERRRAEAHLFWPDEPYRDDRSILVAGCGTTQAAHYALRWPRAQVIGIDVSAKSIAFTQGLKRKHALANLEVRQLAVERAAELGQGFEHVVCTGVLHHLPDPDAGLRALHDVLEPTGALNVMVYAPYGRAGVYMLQDYCRRLGIGATAREIGDLAASLKGASAGPSHRAPPAQLTRLRGQGRAGRCAAASAGPILLGPAALGVPQPCRPGVRALGAPGALPALVWRAGVIASPIQAGRTDGRSAIRRHRTVPRDHGPPQRRGLQEGSARAGVRPSILMARPGSATRPFGCPIRSPCGSGCHPGAAAVLINRNHTYTDLYLPIDARQERLLAAIDGERTIAEICREPGDRNLARAFFQQLWRWDQVVFNTSQALTQCVPQSG